MNKRDTVGLLILIISAVYAVHTFGPLLSTIRPPGGSGTCYAIGGWQLRNTFAVFIDHQGVPSGINWDADISNALSQYNSKTHFSLYTITTNSLFAQLTISFGQVDSSSELGVASFNWDPRTGTESSATIVLDQTKPWSDNPGYIVTEYSVEHVLLHEIGHVTGLGHISQSCDDVMTPATYNGQVRTTLGTGDMAGVRAIYGA